MASNVILNGQIGLPTHRQQLAAAGKVFSVNTPSPGTGVAYAQLTAFSATANGLFVIANNNATGSGVNLYFDTLSLFQTASVATGTAISFEVYNETGIVAGTGAVATRTPVNLAGATGDSARFTVQAFSAGAITIPAAVGTRTLQGQGWIPVGVNVVKDNYVMCFGGDGDPSGMGGMTAARATDTARKVGHCNAIIVPPQTTSWINMWGLGTSTPSFEYQLTIVQL